MALNFEDWIVDQQYRKDLIGELACIPGMRDVKRKSSRRKPDEHKNWADIVIEVASPGHIAVFNEAWQEFLLAKQAAEEPPE